jgi:hypothetical protein
MVTGIGVGVVAGYATLFRQAARIHSYWNYWVLLPMAIGAATLALGLVETTADGPARTRLAVRHAGSAAAVALIVLALGTTPPAEVEARAGYAASAPLRHRVIPTSQQRMWVRGDIVEPASWVEFYAHRPVEVLASRAPWPAWRATTRATSSSCTTGPATGWSPPGASVRRTRAGSPAPPTGRARRASPAARSRG